MAVVIEKPTPELIGLLTSHSPAVVLCLTVEEAQTLKWVCQHIGGHPVRTPRGFMDAISRALDKAGIVRGKWKAWDRFNALYFSDPEGDDVIAKS